MEFAAVDCTKNEVICQLMEIKGYPTIYYTSYLKEHSQYTGGRTVCNFFLIYIYTNIFHSFQNKIYNEHLFIF